MEEEELVQLLDSNSFFWVSVLYLFPCIYQSLHWRFQWMSFIFEIEWSIWPLPPAAINPNKEMGRVTLITQYGASKVCMPSLSDLFSLIPSTPTPTPSTPMYHVPCTSFSGSLIHPHSTLLPNCSFLDNFSFLDDCLFLDDFLPSLRSPFCVSLLLYSSWFLPSCIPSWSLRILHT